MKNSKRIRLECIHADTCLPSYWSGHHYPHVQIAALSGMSGKDIRDAIKSELSQGAVMGNSHNAMLLASDYVGPENAKEAEQIFKAAIAAVNRMRPATKGKRKFFTDLEPLDDNADGSDSVYAYFVFVELE